MKKVISISLMLFVGIVLLASCRKRDYYDNNNSGIETAIVVDYYNGYPYSIIKFERDLTYAIIENLDENYPERAQVLEGVFEQGRQTTVRNLDYAENLRIATLEYADTEAEAYDALDYYADQYDAVNGVSATQSNNRVLATQSSSKVRILPLKK